MRALKFLLDEDSSSKLLVDALKGRGHDVVLSTDVLGQGAKDAEVGDHACHLGAILVTRNKKHFVKKLGRIPSTALRDGLTPCGIVFFMCDAAVAPERVATFHDLLIAEHELLLDGPDPRIVVEILHNRLIVFR